MLFNEYNKAIRFKHNKVKDPYKSNYRTDNDVFNLKLNHTLSREDKMRLFRENSEKKISDKLRPKSPYLDGKRNNEYINPSYKSQVFTNINNKPITSKSFSNKNHKSNIFFSQDKENLSTLSAESKDLININKIENLDSNTNTKDINNLNFKPKSYLNKTDINKFNNKSRNEKVLQQFISHNIHDLKPKITDYYNKVVYKQTDKVKDIYKDYIRDLKKTNEDTVSYRDILKKQMNEKKIQRELIKSKERKISQILINDNKEEFNKLKKIEKEKKEIVKNTLVNENKRLIEVKNQLIKNDSIYLNNYKLKLDRSSQNLTKKQI